MAITIKDVAKLSGTSISSVSRYLNGNPIRQGNKSRIEKAIKELNYEINLSAKGLKTSKSMTVGVVIPFFTRIYDASIVKGINDVIAQNSYYSFIMDTDNNPEKEKEVLNFLFNKRVDGLIVFPSTTDEDLYTRFEDANIPIVFIDQKIDSIKSSSVIADNINAVYQAVEHLIRNGHKEISIICGPKNLFTAKERLIGYERCMIDYGIPIKEEYIKFGDYTMCKGYEKMKELLSYTDRPTGVIITNYDMTKGAILAINELNVNIPEDISVIGYDDIDLTQIHKPRLTMVIQPVREMGKKAANMLLSMMKGNCEYENKVYRFKTEFLNNESVKKL